MPGDFLDDAILQKNHKLLELYKTVVPLIWDHVCYNINPRVPMDKYILTKCHKLQDALIKAGIPIMDHIFDGVQKIIHNNMLLKAVKFNRDGTGQPYLFASEKDVAADLKKRKSSRSRLILQQ